MYNIDDVCQKESLLVVPAQYPVCTRFEVGKIEYQEEENKENKEDGEGVL